MPEARIPTSAADLDHVRDLMRAFIAWHRGRHQEDLDLIDSYFDAAAFEEELATLPGKYAPPDGQLFLATVDGEPAGCVAMRKIDATRCEMKRMFVYPRYHGRGVGSVLAEAIIDAGRAAGYRTMLLDTSVRQTEARALYQRLGFREVPPYYELTDALRHWLVFMERSLSDSPSPIAAAAPAPIFRRIDTVIVRVSALGAAVRWYETVLGLKSVHSDEAERLAVLALEGTSVTLWERAATDVAPAAETAGTYPIFATDDAIGARQELAGRGVIIGPLETGEGVRFFRFADLDGNVLEACEVR